MKLSKYINLILFLLIGGGIFYAIHHFGLLLPILIFFLLTGSLIGATVLAYVVSLKFLTDFLSVDVNNMPRWASISSYIFSFLIYLIVLMLMINSALRLFGM